MGSVNVPRRRSIRTESTNHVAVGPKGIRPDVHLQFVREYTYAYVTVSPHVGVMDSLILPEVNVEAMSIFLAEVAKRHPDEFILIYGSGCLAQSKRFTDSRKHTFNLASALLTSMQSGGKHSGRNQGEVVSKYSL